MATSLFLIVGLGNPGEKYSDTRHNIGFMLADYLAEQGGISVSKSKMQGLYCKLRLHGKQVLLLKPQAYMNRSGECVRRFVDYFDILPEGIFVIHDDIDLPFGRVKAVSKGGAGGHNGIRSIAQHLQTNAFNRLKVGVGRPETSENGKGQPVDKYVLSKFSTQEKNHITALERVIDDAVGHFLLQDINVCMNHINGRELKM